MGELQNNPNFLISKKTIVQVVLVRSDNSETILGTLIFNPGDTYKELPYTFSTILRNSRIKIKRLSGELSNDAFSNSFSVLNFRQSASQQGNA